MAIVKLHSAIKEIRGALGDMVFTPRGDGEAVVRKKGKAPAERTEKQYKNQGRFSDATSYGKAVRDDPQLSAAYADEAKAKRLAPYHIALGDFINPPEVCEIDLFSFSGKAGGVIGVDASKTKVVRLAVSIQDLQGTLLEEGLAEFDDGSGKWLYAARKDVPSGQTIVIEATATDRPGHTATKTAFWALRKG